MPPQATVTTSKASAAMMNETNISFIVARPEAFPRSQPAVFAPGPQVPT